VFYGDGIFAYQMSCFYIKEANWLDFVLEFNSLAFFYIIVPWETSGRTPRHKFRHPH
jgi:hypothetical protein